MTNNSLSVNIGLEECKVRLSLGILFLAGSLFISLIFIMNGTNTFWALVLLPIYYQGVRFIYDYRTGTCPLKAELGQCELNKKFSIFGKKLEDRTHATAIKKKSRKALLNSISAAILLTILTMILMSVKI